MPEDNISPELRHQPRSLVQFRAQLAACLEDMDDGGIAYVRAKELREWINILDAEIAQRQRGA